MKIYKVGGSVRDFLLGRKTKEKDFVVVGGTPEALLAQGFIPVGKNFPVFLHPTTHDEYALARLERKTGLGHGAFEFDTQASVTLEEDLLRRDLTINAIALSRTGQLIDPYHGQEDLKARSLRHVSLAFSEDPLRVLRVARFMAQLADYHFNVAKETLVLMEQIVASDELLTLSPERIYEESKKALLSQRPDLFFETLIQCKAMHQLFPGLHLTLPHLMKAVSQSEDLTVRYAAFAYPTPHVLKAPRDWVELAKLTHRFHPLIQQAKGLSEHQLLDLLLKTDALRRPERFQRLLQVCLALETSTETAAFLLSLQERLAKLDLSCVTQGDLENPDKIKAIETLRLKAIGETKK